MALPPAPGATGFCRLHLAAMAANGFHTFPIRSGTKKADWQGWSSWCQRPPRPDQIARWRERHGHYGLAVATGYACVACDCDEEDPRLAAEIAALAEATLGPTRLVRVGRAPRWIRVYRPCTIPMRSQRLAPTVELIASGRYFVAHGIHPGTRQPYTWPYRAPEACPLADVPVVGMDRIARFAALLAGLYGLPAPVLDDGGAADTADDPRGTGTQGARGRAARYSVRPDLPYPRDGKGLVCDGREAYLTRCVYAAFCAGAADAADIADAAWARFAATTNLVRPKRDGECLWTYADALGKARALLARGKARPAPRLVAAQDEACDPVQLAAFRHAVDACGARGALAPSAVAVSHAMLEYARRSGVCCASPETLAAVVGRSVSAVKTARRALIAAGLWSATNTRGGRARGADYRPVLAILEDGNGEPAADRTVPPQEGNGADLLHPNNRFGCGLPPPDEARDGTSSRSTNPPESLVSPGFPAPSQRYRQKRSQGVASSVAEMPNGLPAQSDTRMGGRA